METFTKNTTIGELLSVYPECAPILMEIGMHCLGLLPLHSSNGFRPF